jgi:hypothetical protein
MPDLPSLDQWPGSNSKPDGGMDADGNPPDPVQAEGSRLDLNQWMSVHSSFQDGPDAAPLSRTVKD